MYKIKCSNGLYIQKTTYGTWLTYSKHGKVFNTKNIALKNLDLCRQFTAKSKTPKYQKLTFTLIELKTNI